MILISQKHIENSFDLFDRISSAKPFFKRGNELIQDSLSDP